MCAARFLTFDCLCTACVGAAGVLQVLLSMAAPELPRSASADSLLRQSLLTADELKAVDFEASWRDELRALAVPHYAYRTGPSCSQLLPPSLLHLTATLTALPRPNPL